MTDSSVLITDIALLEVESQLVTMLLLDWNVFKDGVMFRLQCCE